MSERGELCSVELGACTELSSAVCTCGCGNNCRSVRQSAGAADGSVRQSAFCRVKKLHVEGDGTGGVFSKETR